MPGMKGMTGSVQIAREGKPPYYGVLFDDEAEVHKWLAEDEIEEATSGSGDMKMTLAKALALPRVAICGGANTGKTTLANTVTDGRDVVHTDDFIGTLPEVGGGAIIAESLANTPRFVLEGTKAANALRAGLVVDVVIWAETVHVEHTPGQARQARGIETVFHDWLAQDGGRTPVVMGG